MTDSAVTPQKPIHVRLEEIALVILAAIGLVGLHFHHPESASRWDILSLIGLGAVGFFRWTWFIVRVVRSWIYQHWVFRRWRQRANRIATADLPPLCFLVPTYKEQLWVSERVFRAIAQEAATLAQPVILLVNSSGDEENAAIQTILEAENPNYRHHIHLIQMTQRNGKRKAMADALHHLRELNLPADTVIALMDGDSELAPGTLRQCLPFFRLLPRMGALTTDELPKVKGSYLFSEWFHLRFAQRHYQMCSDSLAGKVMCLTGRFSLFRAEAALDPSFAAQLENDTLDDWLWGQFKFLSGDDKSTWFWLLRQGYDMLYIPDALVYSIETVSGSVIDRAYANMRRWYGNMLRNSGRAIALGHKKIGWFTWYSLIDQRISIWTSLLTPGFLLISLLQRNWTATVLILSWIVFSRIVMLWIVFWGRSSHLKLVHFPILLMTQWSSSLVKIWTQMNLARQNWSNRSSQTVSAEGVGRERAIKLGTSRLLLFCQLFTFGLLLCWLNGILNPIWDMAGLWLNYTTARQPAVRVVKNESLRTIVPNDNRDDAAALQAVIDQLDPGVPVQIELPIGEIDLFSPVEISRGQITLKGQGVARTVLRSHLPATSKDAVLVVRPKAVAIAQTSGVAKAGLTTLNNVELSHFSLRQAESNQSLDNQLMTEGIRLENVSNSSVKHLALEQATHESLILSHTKDVAVEYVSFDNTSNSTGLVLHNPTTNQTKKLTLTTPPT